MGVSLSAKGAKSESDVAGGQKPVKGRYLAMVKAVDETMDKKDQVNVDFEVLAGNVPDQRGRILTEYFSVSEKALPRLTRLALCLNLLQPDQVADVSFAAGVGRVLFIEVEDHSYDKDGKKVETVRVSFGGMWSLGNPDVADLHKVPEIANMLNTLRGNQGGAGGAVAASTPPTQPTNSGAATSDKSKWGSLV